MGHLARDGAFRRHTVASGAPPRDARRDARNLALAHPERVQALVIQNAVAHEQGLSDLWVSRKAFWADRAAHEAAVRANLLSLEATRQRHVGRSPHPERIDPETWEGEYALLTRPGMIDIQLDLFHDYL